MGVDILERLVQPILEKLKTNIVPWHHTPKSYWGFARNYVEDTPYTGFNWLLLNLIENYNSPWFLTEAQIQTLGGTLKKKIGRCIKSVDEVFLSKGITLSYTLTFNRFKTRPKIVPIAWGRGTLKILNTCKAAGLPEPDITELDGGILVTLYKDKYTETQLIKLGLNQRQIKAVLFLKDCENIEVLPGVELDWIADDCIPPGFQSEETPVSSRISSFDNFYETIKNDSEFSIHPNPSNGTIDLSFPETEYTTRVTIILRFRTSKIKKNN